MSSEKPIVIYAPTHAELVEMGEFVLCPTALASAHGVHYPVFFTQAAWAVPSFVPVLPKIKSILSGYKEPGQLFLRGGRKMECGKPGQSFFVHFGMSVEKENVQPQRIVTVYLRGEE